MHDAVVKILYKEKYIMKETLHEVDDSNVMILCVAEHNKVRNQLETKAVKPKENYGMQ